MSDGEVARKNPSDVLRLPVFLLTQRGWRWPELNPHTLTSGGLSFTHTGSIYLLSSPPAVRESDPESKCGLKVLRRTMVPLGTRLCLCGRVCGWGWLWRGRREQAETQRSELVEGICRVPLPCFVLSLLVPFFCICLGGSWSVLLINSIFPWHLSSDWLKDLEGGKKTLIK